MNDGCMLWTVHSRLELRFASALASARARAFGFDFGFVLRGVWHDRDTVLKRASARVRFGHDSSMILSLTLVASMGLRMGFVKDATIELDRAIQDMAVRIQNDF